MENPLNNLEQLKQHPDFEKFLSSFNKFVELGGEITNVYPILNDFNTTAGQYGGHYFHQDLLVASFIYKKNPIRHIDIGSRIDGFVAHVASFRKIEVSDIRDLPNTGHENISFMRADLMNESLSEITDSISCLHAIEHFGLGRYSDSIDPNGHVRGLQNILRMLKKNGTLYISFPIGVSNEVHFNAHRVFHPKDIFKWFDFSKDMELQRFDYVDDLGTLYQNVNLVETEISTKYGCGIYSFRKLK